MKIRFMLLSLLIPMVAACAGNGTRSDLADHHRVKDQRYITAVEAKADKVGVEVIWVNPPTRDDRDR